MNEKSTCDKYNNQAFTDSPIKRRKSDRSDKEIEASKNSVLLGLLCACFRTSANKKKRKIKDKYESVLYLQPKEDTKEDIPVERKPDFNKSLSNGIERSSVEDINNMEHR